MNSYENVVSLLQGIGQNSLYLLVIVGTIRLYSRIRYLVSFLFLCLINVGLVKCAKILIREPRPKELLLDKTNPEYYGMPSGHAFHVSFMTMFLWMVCPSLPILYFCIIVIGITLVERYVDKYHTVKQLVAGLISGTAFAYMSVLVLRHYFENSTTR